MGRSRRPPVHGLPFGATQRRWTSAPSSSPEKPWHSVKRSSGRSSRTSPSATRSRVPAPPHPSLAPPRSDRIRSGALRTPSCLRREVAFVRSRPVRRPIDGGGVSRLACSSPGPARSTREEAAHVRCSIGFGGGQCLSLADYVTMRDPRIGRPPPEGVRVAYARRVLVLHEHIWIRKTAL